jgi:hypothetical protein
MVRDRKFSATRNTYHTTRHSTSRGTQTPPAPPGIGGGLSTSVVFASAVSLHGVAVARDYLLDRCAPRFPRSRIPPSQRRPPSADSVSAILSRGSSSTVGSRFYAMARGWPMIPGGTASRVTCNGNSIFAGRFTLKQEKSAGLCGSECVFSDQTDLARATDQTDRARAIIYSTGHGFAPPINGQDLLRVLPGVFHLLPLAEFSPVSTRRTCSSV